MSRVIRARVRRHPDIDVTSIDEVGPVTVHGGWRWYLHIDGAPISSSARAAGITGNQPRALDEACAALKRFAGGRYW